MKCFDAVLYARMTPVQITKEYRQKRTENISVFSAVAFMSNACSFILQLFHGYICVIPLA
jgi:uncharacterized protein with PQ loop repeat